MTTVPTPAENPRTFICYAAEDSVFALDLAKQLRSAGVAVWIDKLDIPAGARWDRAVEQALEKCPRLLVILSPASVSSENVLDEINYALDENKDVIPVLYRECKIPFRLRRFQRIDARDGIMELMAMMRVEAPAVAGGQQSNEPRVDPYDDDYQPSREDTLHALSQQFSTLLDLDELFTKVASTIRMLIGYDAFSIMLVDLDRRLLRHRFSVRYDQRVVLDNVRLGEGIAGAAAQTREPVRVNDVSSDARYIPYHPDIRSELAVPLIAQDRVIGVLELESERTGFFTPEHVDTLTLLAPQIAGSVENARLFEELQQRDQRMQQDLRAAQRLRSVLELRAVPEIPGLEIAIKGRAAFDITADLYEFFVDSKENAVLAFGDVSEHGAASALQGAVVSSLLRIHVRQKNGPGAILRSLNESLFAHKVEAQYATLLVLLWESSTRKLTMASAGASPPLICRNDEIIQPSVEGMPIGLLEQREYEEVVFICEPGDCILLCSDGVADQMNDSDGEFGYERLFQSLKQNGLLAPQQLVNAIFSELDTYMNGTTITDDQTILAMRVTGRQ